MPIARAQRTDPAVDACRAHAKRELSRDGAAFKDVVFDRGPALLSERYARKLGSQSVSSILSGRGALVYEGSPSVELEFLCLLANDSRPLFFHWTPRRDAGALSRCSRGPAPYLQTRTCVEALLALEETELTQAAAIRFQESRAADSAAGNGRASDAFRAAAAAWQAYRDAECLRRASAAHAVESDELARLSCMADLTRQRARDLGEAR